MQNSHTKNAGLITIIAITGHAMGSTTSTDAISDRVTYDNAGFITVDISGLSAADTFGDPDNSFISLIHLPKEPDQPTSTEANALIGIGWDLSLTTVGTSWATDTTINFGGLLDVTFSKDAYPVINQHYSSPGIINLADAGYAPIHFGIEEHAMRIEFFESFDDTQNMAESYFEEGSVLYLKTLFFATATIPAPTTAPLLALAALAASKRKR